GLAARQLRHTLIDLARHYQGPQGPGPNHAGHPATPTGREAADRVPDVPDPAEGADELDRWSAFHAAVEVLPEDEREGFDLVFYHDWSQARVAQLLAVSTRTVRRHWHAACARLRESLDGDFPRP